MAELIILHTLFMFVVVLFPLARIYKRAGVNQIGAFTVFIPGIGFTIAIVILAFSRWKEFE